MKTTSLFFLTLIFLQACSNPSESKTDKIRKVETGLIHPVYLEGDSTWTIEERMAHYGVPGVSIAVIRNSEIDWVKSYGVVDKESQSPVTTQTLFQAASISKPLTAYGALKLVEQNKLGLDKDVNTYLQSWNLPDNEFTEEKAVTLKQLLNHSGGLTVHGFLGYSPGLPVPALAEVLDGTPPANSAAIRVDKLPEESFRYSGGGYCIVQQMMIDTERNPFPAIMKALVLQPLGMNNSTYDQPLRDEQLKMASTGYLPDGSMTKGKSHTYPEMAAAGLWTTAEDLAKFPIDIQKTLKGESETVLSKHMAAQMLTPFVEDFIGLGIFLDKKKDDIYFGHGGWNEGFSSQFIAHKNKGYGVVVLTNANHPAFVEELIRSVALTYGWDNFVPVYKKMEPDQSEIAEITGRYRLNNDALIEIYQSGNSLFKKELREDAVELFKISDSTYISRENNQPILFKANTENGFNMLILNADNETIESDLSRMKDGEKLPFEFLEAGNFEQAAKEYQRLTKADPDDPAIQETRLNQTGYRLLNSGKVKLARDIFKINMFLYPDSFNVYDSYAEACLKNSELDLAVENYKKSLELNPENANAEKMLEEIQKNDVGN
ncbi:serine hydrolase domain-containing protein [Sinomicrobium weinanense]|uniref:Serine hydrolase n=1 Tax=Sinomicrobium weinanense TaxID=2842200 RepID=A0A926JWP1_9FLAO|nr:serine hydrolase domain-containing protein [Sinomicrobium weinanense]MBC9798546.1 serine hydrolase [Sinomicrobium weinanense]MBU3122537.1 serine hydrolase [Sinomicrobium weinanense]